MKYNHREEVHNLESPQEIVPEIMRLLNPKSVVDFGCGVGTFLHCFKNNGVSEVLGLDGTWADKQLLNKFLNSNEFKEVDLENKIALPTRYDLVVSVEVAEHLSASAADTFVQNLVNAGEVILFSAAIPLQGGQNHINEQWLDYWEEKFAQHNYAVHDVLKPIFWNNANIYWWYKQNMVIVAPKEFKFSVDVTYNTLKNVVHPELYQSKAKGDIKRYVKKVVGHNGAMFLKKVFSPKKDKA